MPPAHACRRCRVAFATRAEFERHLRKVHAGGGPPRWTWAVAGVALLALLGGGAAYAILAAEPASAPDFALEGEPRLGRADAPVALVAFEDPSCPYCRMFHVGERGPSTFDRLVADYVDTGRARVHYKEFLAAHPWGRAGAIAQECALAQDEGAFWNLTSKLYRDAPRIDDANVMARAAAYAREEGLDAAAFDACMRSDAPRDRIREEMRTGEALGVTGTPAFFVVAADGTSELIVGPQPYETFAAAIERALAKGPRA